MTFAPLNLMMDRVCRHGADSDTALFTELLYAGEFVLKFTVAAFVSAIEDDRESHRYRLLHGIVRADGVGEWAGALDEALSGTATQQLSPALFEARKVFTERLGKGTWQHEAVCSLHEVLRSVYDGTQSIGDRVALRAWFQMFAELRNKTRGHGAITPAMCAKLAPKLNESVRLLCTHNPIFALPWAYLHRNLSGKYRVAEFGNESDVFNKLKSAAAADGENYSDGIYLWAGRFRQVDLVYTNLDISDFFFPNGAFRNGTYELHSLISDSRLKGNAGPYQAAASERPPSETEGKGELDALGQVLTNLPTLAPGYVRRPRLEAEVCASLTNDRHPIVTLVGRGGIGKTSLVLAALREIAKTNCYDVIVWFSARDIDLMLSGAKPVQPRVLTERDIAEQYRTLVGPTREPGDKNDPVAYMAQHLRKSPNGATLFVFDNFETVRSPIDLFQWIDTNIRLPNKAVITTRFRDFKADYPIEVSGMEQKEAEALVEQTAATLGIGSLLGKKERDLLIEESDGHPYVIKIILGEVANTRAFSKPSKLMARKEDILDALFERTYSSLSPIAVRIFLTLSGWRSLVPQLAVEAVLRYGSDGGNPEDGIEQLVRMSFIERRVASDGTDFLEVPLTAALFGKRKLEVSAHRPVIESDIRFLQDIGATATSGLKDGIRPRVESFFKRASRKISDGVARLDELRPILEFFARGYPPAWLLLSELDLEHDSASPSGTKHAAEAIRRYLESQPPALEMQAGWQRLLSLYRSADDVIGGCGAFLRAAEIVAPLLDEISTMANWLNSAPELKTDMDVVERSALFKPLASLMEARLSEASATDLSRLGWMHLHSGNEVRALQVAELGLKQESGNIYCQRLVKKLTIDG